MKTETIKEHARKLPGKTYGIIVRTIKTATGFIVRLRHDSIEGEVAFTGYFYFIEV